MQYFVCLFGVFLCLSRWICLGSLLPCGTVMICKLGCEYEEFYLVLTRSVALISVSTSENPGAEDAFPHS